MREVARGVEKGPQQLLVRKLAVVVENLGFVEEVKKRNILKQLPYDLVEQLHAELHQAQIEEDKYARRRHRTPEILSDTTTVTGKLFEVLAAIEFPEGNSDVGQEILTLLHDPDRFQLMTDRETGRNPDLVFVKTTATGAVEIEAVGEAKSGLVLRRRCFRQLKDSGIKENLRRTVWELNRHRDLEEYGLTALSARGGKVKISSSFRQILIMPADADILSPETMIDRGSFYYRDKDHEDEYKDFAKLLKNPRKVEIRRSCFSSEEVGVMAEVLVPLIRMHAIR